jgi:hypothetical protein
MDFPRPFSLDADPESRGQDRSTSHISRQKAVVRYPDFLYADQETVTCAAFIEESRMKLVNASKVHRKSGGMGHPNSLPRQ